MTEINKEIQSLKEEKASASTIAEQNEKKRRLKETERFKKKYFEYYDDVKISHREDW